MNVVCVCDSDRIESIELERVCVCGIGCKVTLNETGIKYGMHMQN